MKVWRATLSPWWEVEAMCKLMSANLFRLWRDKIFWITVAAMVIFSLVNILSGCRQAMQATAEFEYTLDDYFFSFLPMVGLFITAFISLFQGTEYSDGTMRNKLIIGHYRIKVYFANFLTNYVASVVVLLVGFFVGIVGVPILGWLEVETTVVVSYLVVSLLMVGAWSAIFTLISLLTTNKAYGVVFCILLWLGLTFLGSYFYNVLSEPEMQSGAIVTMEGITIGEPTLNPNYVSGIKRHVYEFLSDFFPSSQAIQMSNLEAVHPIRMMLCSLGITVMATLGGIMVFRRKDLK